MPKSNAEVMLAAYDLMETAIEAGSQRAAIAPVRAELEVLSREDLVSVALAVTVESTMHLTARADRAKFLQRLRRVRLEVMWSAS